MLLNSIPQVKALRPTTNIAWVVQGSISKLLHVFAGVAMAKGYIMIYPCCNHSNGIYLDIFLLAPWQQDIFEICPYCFL